MVDREVSVVVVLLFNRHLLDNLRPQITQRNRQRHGLGNVLVNVEAPPGKLEPYPSFVVVIQDLAALVGFKLSDQVRVITFTPCFEDNLREF